jgi:hypothetical protein
MVVSASNRAAATTVVRRLTGNRWTWPPVRVVERYPVRGGRLLLRGRPVTRVVTLTDRRTSVPLGYELTGNGFLTITDRGYECRPNVNAEVTYEYGSRPSILATKAIGALAYEFSLAEAEDGACRLPQRVTSVNRQGLSWTMIDPQDYLDKGRTGVGDVDLLLASLGTHKARARVFSSEFPPPTRLSTTRLADPGNDQYVTVGRGESLEMVVTYRDLAGAPVDMTGGSAQLLVKKLGTGETLHTVNSDAVGLSGVITVRASAATTATWAIGDYAFVVAYTDASGTVKWVEEGALAVEPGGA